MCPNKKRINLVELERYRLPIYSRKSKEKIVYFYVLDPRSVVEGNPKMVRIRKKFNHIHGAREREEAALRFREEVARKLREGWNPLEQDCGTKGFTPFEDVLEKYFGWLQKLLKDNVITNKTFQDYKSRLDMLKKFNDKKNARIMYIYQLKTAYIESFLEWVYVDRDNSPRTRNNYLTWFSSFCGWLVQTGYADSNPSANIKNLKEKDKIRTVIAIEDMEKLRAYLMERDSYFLLCCMMQYYTFIRPNELMQLKVGDISVEEQTVFVSHKISKNRKDGKVTLPVRVIRFMEELGVLGHPATNYLFSHKFRPGAERCSPRKIISKWMNLRKALDFPKNYQFYSLKDTGITDMIDVAGLSTAKDQARHSSVAITNHYVKNQQLVVHPELKNFEGNL